MIDEEKVREIALALPGVMERPSYDGVPSWRTKPRIFACMRDDPDALVVWVEDLDEKRHLIETQPDIFFTTPHYDKEPIVLVNLDAVDADRAAELITESWLIRAPKSLTKQYLRGERPTE